jgi:hypothetical protein
MSSWANRGIFPKRNLAQIPEGLRPTIITRAQRPEVILSESFQENEKQNEVIYPSGSEDSIPDISAYSRSYPRKMEFNPAPNAIELRFLNKSYVFVILRNIRITRDNDLWMASYQSIRRFYTNQIIIIDDNSDINTVNGKLVNTEVIHSDYNGAGEILPYYYFLPTNGQIEWSFYMIACFFIADLRMPNSVALSDFIGILATVNLAMTEKSERISLCYQTMKDY